MPLPEISRREFFQGTKEVAKGAGAVAVATAIDRAIQPFTGGFPAVRAQEFTEYGGSEVEALERTELVSFIEDEFQVKLQKPKGFREISSGWLLTIMNQLRAMPEHFYRPDSNGITYSLTIDNPGTETRNEASYCVCGAQGYEESVRLRGFSEIRQYQTPGISTFTTLGHELTHLLTLVKLVYSTDGNSEHEYPNHTMFSLRKDIFNLFSFPNDTGKQEQLNVREKIVGLNPGIYDLAGNERLLILRDVEYGLRKNFPIEFTAVLGSHYALGKEYFLRIYTEVFNEEKAEALYNLFKEKVFFGREYQSYEWAPGFGYFDEVEAILGGSLEQIREPLIEKSNGIRKSRQEQGLYDDVEDGSEDDNINLFLYFFPPSLHGVELEEGKVLPDKFISTMQLFYIEGREYFSKRYGIIFDAETVDKLYDFVKTRIFKGKEFTASLTDTNP